MGAHVNSWVFMGVHGCSWVLMGVHGCSCDIFVVLFKSIFFKAAQPFFGQGYPAQGKIFCLDQGYPAQENLYVK